MIPKALQISFLGGHFSELGPKYKERCFSPDPAKQHHAMSTTSRKIVLGVISTTAIMTVGFGCMTWLTPKSDEALLKVLSFSLPTRL